MKTKYTTLTDDQLAKMVNEGNENAFGEIYNRYYKKLLSYVKNKQLHHCGEAYEAEDIVQNTFVLAHKALMKEKFDFQKSIFPWLMTIAKNHYINLFRRSKKVVAVSYVTDDEIMDNRLLPYFEDGASYELKQVKEYVMKASSQIPKRLQSIVFYLVNGYKYEEIADELNLSLGTVRSRIHYLKKELLIIMQKDGVGIEALL